MRTTHLLLASAVCALLAGCDGGALTAPDAGRLAIDTQCPEADCGGTTITPSYSFKSTTSLSRSLTWTGTHYSHKGSSWSDIGSDRYTYATVSATATKYELCYKPTVFGSASKTVYGPGTALVSFRFETYEENWGFGVQATHFFKASQNYPWLTDLTFQSHASHCHQGDYFG